MPDKQLQNTSAPSTIRYDNLDLLKTIAIFLVVCLHHFFLPINFLQNDTPESYVGYAIRIFCEGVPIFVMVSGFLLFSKPFNFSKAKHKIIKFFLLILGYSVFYLIITNIITGRLLSPRGILLEILNLSSTSNSYIGFLWYLQSLISVYLIFPLLKLAFGQEDKHIFHFITAIVVLFSLGLNTFQLALRPIAASLGMNNISSAIYTFAAQYNPFSKTTFLAFFLIGGEIYLFRNKLKTQKAHRVALISLIISIIVCTAYGILTPRINTNLFNNNFVYGSIFMAIILINLYILTQNYRNKNKLTNFLSSIGKYSLGIYLLHIFFITLSRQFGISAFFAQAPWGIGLIIENIGITLVSYITTRTILKTPILRKTLSL